MAKEIISQEDIQIIVDRAFNGEDVQVLKYELEIFSKDKEGFLGTHETLILTIKRKNTNEPETHRFFVKSVPDVPEVQQIFMRTYNIFNQEATYFNEILPFLRKSCPKTQDWSPKCYLATDKFVVLEDLRLRNYVMSNNKLFNEEQLQAAFKAQARLHATAVVAQKKLGKPLNQVYPKNGMELLFNVDTLERKKLDMFTDLAEKVAERLGLDNRRIRPGLRKGFDQMHDQSKLSSKLPKVFEHSDSWPNNYLFDDSQPINCIIVDYQFLRYGPPMYDLLMLAYLSTDREFRKKVIPKALELYHRQFCEVLEENDSEIVKPTLQDVIDEYEELKMTVFVVAFLYYPIIWLGPETVEKYNDAERATRIMFRDENSFVMQLYDEDKVFATKINEIAEEAVEYFEKQGVPINENQ